MRALVLGVVLSIAAGGRPAAAQDTSMVQGGIYQRPLLAGSNRTAVGGYAEGSGRYLVSDGVSEGWSMELRRFNIFFFSSVGRRIRFTSELEFEHGTEEIALETALVDFVITPSVVVRAGILLPPIGAFNVNHDGPRYDFVDRPLVSTEVIPATLSEAGFGLHGRLAPGGLAVSYDGYLTNGLGDGVVLNGTGRTRIAEGKTEEQFAEDNNGSPAFSGRVAVHAPGWGELGVSYYGGIYNRFRIDGIEVDRKRRLSLYAIDLATAIGPLELRGETAWARIDVAESLGELMAEAQWGFYLDAVLPFWRPRIRGLDQPVVSAVLRLERVDLNQGRFASTGGARGDDTDAFTIGLSFRPVAGTVLRAGYQRQSFRDLLGNTPARTAGFQVGFATYF